jgi:predicted RNA-binding Zn-ribbon protein involved in translation (DUF1610 family)
MIEKNSKYNQKSSHPRGEKKEFTPRKVQKDYRLTDKHQKQKNQSILNKVIAWQNFKFAKPLTCQQVEEDGATLCGGKLVPMERGFRVVLKCPKCGAVQPYVPKQVIESDFSSPTSLKRNQLKYHDFDPDQD